MSRASTSGRGLEAAKFAVYLSIPIIATCVYGEPEILKKLVTGTNYISYPPSSREDFEKAMAKAKADRQEWLDSLEKQN